MRRCALLLAGLVIHSYAAAAVPTTYGETLLESVVRANPQVSAATIVAVPPKASDAIVAASTDRASIGTRAAAADAAAMSATASAATPLPASGGTIVRLALHDVSGDPIGGLTLSFRSTDVAAAQADAERIREWLHRRISHAGNLFDPVPYEPGAPSGTYAQQLADAILDEHPEIEILAIHATPPGTDYNIIAASNIGRIGKKADNDDMRCVFTGKPNLEVNSTGKRFESEMQLHDRAGHVVGAVGIVVAYRSGDDKNALHAHAEAIRREMERKIADAGSLFQPAK